MTDNFKDPVDLSRPTPPPYELFLRLLREFLVLLGVSCLSLSLQASLAVNSEILAHTLHDKRGFDAGNPKRDIGSQLETCNGHRRPIAALGLLIRA